MSGEWQPIETAPPKGEFLGYGAYLYPDDEHPTEYWVVAKFTGYSDWPYETSEGLHAPGFLSHWMPLPPRPEVNK